jgi:hypothetical protein
MITYHDFCQIKHLHEHQGLNASQIAEALSRDPRTVSYWLDQEHFRARKLGIFHASGKVVNSSSGSIAGMGRGRRSSAVRQ